ncbi:MAG: orotidine-5'-phosphate decarboxylase [Gammaproteobacteria bacterium]
MDDARRTFREQLEASWAKNDSLLCVGLDPDLERLPAHLLRWPQPIFAFNRAIVDATADLVCAYKPQIAHYSAVGAERELERTIAYIHARHPGIPVILDAKRGDIGSTAVMYAREAFERYDADAVTVNPYLGYDALVPFLAHADRGIFVLCRTSNPGGREIQGADEPDALYLKIARLACEEWDENANVSFVVGATEPEAIARVRAVVGERAMLVPGIGTQGGEAGEVVAAGLDSQGTGLVINSARSVIYADDGLHFADAAREVAMRTCREINAARGRIKV